MNIVKTKDKNILDESIIFYFLFFLYKDKKI